MAEIENHFENHEKLDSKGPAKGVLLSLLSGQSRLQAREQLVGSWESPYA
jgi:hypothetical protein